MSEPAASPVRFTSQSRIGCWERCGEQFRRRYICGERMAPGIAALRGTAVHEGARVNFRQKITSHTDLPTKDIVDAAAEKFRTASAGEIALSEEEAAMGVKRVVGLGLDETVRYAHAHATLQAPDYQPVLVEERVAVPSGIEGLQVEGSLDLAATEDKLVDLKTKAKTPAARDVSVSTQLTIYGLLFRARVGRWPKQILQDNLVGLQRGVERVVQRTTRGPADVAALAERITSMETAIKAGNFVPASPEHWSCSPRYCGFYRTCKYVNPKR